MEHITYVKLRVRTKLIILLQICSLITILTLNFDKGIDLFFKIFSNQRERFQSQLVSTPFLAKKSRAKVVLQMKAIAK